MLLFQCKNIIYIEYIYILYNIIKYNKIKCNIISKDGSLPKRWSLEVEIKASSYECGAFTFCFMSGSSH